MQKKKKTPKNKRMVTFAPFLVIIAYFRDSGALSEVRKRGSREGVGD